MEVSMKYPCRLLIALTLTLALSGVKTANANPDIKDEAIKVLINFKTNCNLQKLSREVTKNNGLRFTAECSDVTFYPDGLIVLCPVRDVDMSCKIMTKPKRFKFLNLIYGPMGKRTLGSPEKNAEK